MTSRASNYKSAGFTLVELMIVVAIVAILAVVATVAYTRYLRNSRVIEAQELLGQIQLRQEAYFEANGYYCNASLADGNFHPAFTDGVFDEQDWAPAGNWASLGVRVDRGKTYFSYSVVAGAAVGGFALTARATALGLAAGRPWYYAEARADMDQQGTPYTQVIVTSLRRQPVTFNGGQ